MHNILLSLDSSLFIPSLTLINSVIKNNSNDVSFYILVNEKKDIYEEMLKSRFPKTFFEIRKFRDYDFFEDIIHKLKNNSAKKHFHIFNIMNFARFYLPIIFKSIDKGIYLDIDMIVRKNFKYIIKEYDYFNKDFDIMSPLIMTCESMNINKIGCNGPAFNAGFFVWNLKKFREEKLIHKVKELIILQMKENIWKLGTQPILNIIYYNKVINLNPNWNANGFGKICISNNEIIRFNEKGSKAFIIHWSANVKPWEDSKVRGYKYWKEYLIY